jgi:hypothetical protein
MKDVKQMNTVMQQMPQPKFKQEELALMIL